MISFHVDNTNKDGDNKHDKEDNTYVDKTDKEGDDFNDKADGRQHNPYQQIVQSLYKINHL